MARGRRKDCPDVAPRIRRAFITACKRNGGHSYLANKIENSLEKDFIGTLNALAKFNPKVQNVNNTNTLEIKIDSSVESWVEGYKSGVASLEQQAPNKLPMVIDVDLQEAVLEAQEDVEKSE